MQMFKKSCSNYYYLLVPILLVSRIIAVDILYRAFENVLQLFNITVKLFTAFFLIYWKNKKFNYHVY